MHDDAVKMLRNLGAIVNLYQNERETPEEFAGRVGSCIMRLRDGHRAAHDQVHAARCEMGYAATCQFVGDENGAKQHIAAAYKALTRT